MIIDSSYFYGNLEIPQKSQATVLSNLNWLISQYEAKFLTELLGYSLYKDFMSGIIADPVLSKWSNLLNGVEYTNRFGKLDKWKGLLRTPDGSIAIDFSSKIDIVVGRGNTYDPVADTTTTTIPASLVGKDFVFIQRGFGPLRSDEYSISGSTLTLLGGLIFSQDDTYSYLGNSATAITGSGDNLFKESPIANYVYYWYLRANATTTAGGGEASNNVSIPTTPATKMARAWNQMVEWNRELIEFLYSNNTVYSFDTMLFSYYGGYWNYSPAFGKQSNLLTPISIF